MTFFRKTAAVKAAVTLAGIGALHIAWGRGSHFPLRSRKDLATAVFAGEEFPSTAACYVVGAALITASALTLGVGGRHWWARAGVNTVAGVLAIRGVAGVTGQTKNFFPDTRGAKKFAELDRKVYGPLCLVLAALVWVGTRRPESRRSEPRKPKSPELM